MMPMPPRLFATSSPNGARSNGEFRVTNSHGLVLRPQRRQTTEVMAAVQQNGKALQFAAATLKTDKELALWLQDWVRLK